MQRSSRQIPFKWRDGELSLFTGFSSSSDTISRAISGDGRVVVGDGRFSGGTQAFRYQDETLFGLGDLPGGEFFSVALDASYDGSVIVGRGESTPGFEPFVWTEEGGMVSLKSWLLGKDIAAAKEWHLEQAGGVSADGNVIVGWGNNPSGRNEAWLVRVPEPNALMLCLLVSLLGAARARHFRCSGRRQCLS